MTQQPDRARLPARWLGGFTAPLVCEELRADALVYLASMIARPGETLDDWWANTGHDRKRISSDPNVSFFNGVPHDLAREARARGRDQQGEWMSRPWPAARHPTIPTRAILCLDDRFFPASFREVRSISLGAFKLGPINPRVCSEQKFIYRRRAARLLA